jgi:flagellar motor switch protein FliM
VLVPQRILLKDPVDPAAAKDAGASAWGARFGEEVMRSTVSIVATMPVSQLTLGELSVLSVGQVVPFDIEARNKVVLTARGRTLFMGEFGKLGQNYTVRVASPYDGEQDIIDELLPAARR